MKHLLILLLLALAVRAQAVDISGFVRDTANGESLPFASVYLKDQNWGGITNESGYYAIAGVPPGRYILVVSMIGYAVYREELVVADEDILRDIRLGEEAIEVEDTVIEADREEVESFDISPSRTILQMRELKTAPAAIEADPIRTIQTLPGVATLSDFSVGLYVRGGTPDQNLILLDGTDVYNASHMFGLFSTFPADAAKSTELLRGGYPAKYGGRLSSVLNVITNEGNKQEVDVDGGLSLLASRMTVQGPALKGSWLVSARRTHLDPLMAVARDALEAKALGYNFYDLQGKTH
ncbi:MAG: TonB-dependent receptor, partial [Candidatus Latescibacterota bacterium]|nr:TonB-dependent receptor [Candidatus Latescibacterota bacterium]